MKSPCYTLIFVLLTGTVATPCGPFFYAAPPPLKEYPPRHSVKLLADILRECNPKPDNAASREEIRERCESLVALFAEAEEGILLEMIEVALRRNREGEYRPRYANFLFELRELVGVAPKEATQAYVAHRWAMVEGDHTEVRRSLARQFAVAGKREAFVASALLRAETEQDQRVYFQGKIAEAEASLRPHWQVQYAAWAFRNGAFAEAMAAFDEVLAMPEASARQEVAWIMRARCDIEAARQVVKSGSPWKPLTKAQEARVFALQEEGRQRLQNYLAANEQGRFRADALGWLGAIHSDRKDFALALESYASQLDVKTTREVKRCALRECDRVLREMTEAIARGHQVASLDSAMVAVARHPSVATLVLYHFLDPSARISLADYPYREDWDGEKLRGFHANRLVLPRRLYRKGLQVLGRELGKHQARYQESRDWDSRYHMILARVAADQGEYETALRLCTDADETDGVALTQAAILEASGDQAAAAQAYLRFIDTFPESPLLSDVVRLRCSQALALSGQAGRAVSVLVPSLVNSDARVHTWEELYQWYDTLLLFAPLDQLERAFPLPEDEPRLGADFAMNFRSRAIAAGTFEQAKRYVRPLDKALIGDTRHLGPHYGQLDEARWDAEVKPIEELLRKRRESEIPAERGAICYELGRAWEQRRGFLTMPDSPLSRRQHVMLSESERLWQRRRVNAAELGVSTEQAQAELDRRDEAWHAHQAYAEAARLAEGLPLEAKALEAANRCLRLLAELNPYQAGRAFERRDDRLSRKYYDGLQSRHPETEEAKRAVYWTFRSALEQGVWMPGDNAPWIAEQKILKAFAKPLDDRFSRRFQGLLDDLLNDRALSNEALLAQLDALEGTLRPELRSPDDGLHLDRIERLRVFLRSHPDSQPELRRDHRSIVPVPGILPDFIAFNQIAFAKGRSREDEIAAWEGFLKEFPNSAKAEAARLRLTRHMVRQYRTHVGVRAFHWAEGAPILNGYKRLRVRREKPFEAATVFAALDAYEQRYPKGRYSSECAILRGGALMEVEQWGAALDQLLRVLDDAGKGDLHLEASLNLAALFMNLLEPERRSGIVQALRERPAAQKRLLQFMRSDSCGSRLRLMEDFLEKS